MIEFGICKNCILFRNGYCFSDSKPKKATDCVIKCDYYSFNCFKDSFHDGFIEGFGYCDKMKKQPVIEKIENRAKQEVFNKLVEIVNNNNFPEYVEADLIDYLKNEGYDV